MNIRSVIFALAMLLAIVSTAFAKSTVFPLPKDIKYTGEEFPISRDNFEFIATGTKHDILESAFFRYYSIIFRSVVGGSRLTGRQVLPRAVTGVTKCEVYVASGDDTLALETDESYAIDATSMPTVFIKAQTIYGALRAIETFSQLVSTATQ